MLYGILGAFAVLSVVLDQAVKAWVTVRIPYGGAVPVWPGVFHLTNIHNSGMAFSMLEGGRWFFLVVTLLAFCALAYVLKKKWITHPLGLWALAAIAGGAVGNLIDRVRFGYVVDMIEVEFMRFAVFNVADCFVVCGAILLVIYAFFFDKKAKEDTPHDPAG